MSILTILLALLLGGIGGSNVQLTSVTGNGPVTASPFNVMGGGPTEGPAAAAPIATPTPFSVSGGGPTI